MEPTASEWSRKQIHMGMYVDCEMGAIEGWSREVTDHSGHFHH